MRKRYIIPAMLPAAAQWDANMTYGQKAFVTHDGDTYGNASDRPNRGNNPTDNADWWMMFSPVEIGKPNYWEPAKHTREQWLRMIGLQDVSEGDEDAAVELAFKASLTRDGFEFTEIDETLIPATKGFRQAWTFDGSAVAPDRGKAVKLKLREIRGMVSERLAKSERRKVELDDVGNGQQIQAHRNYRVALRALPAQVQAEIASMTVEQLTAYQIAWPVEP